MISRAFRGVLTICWCILSVSSRPAPGQAPTPRTKELIEKIETGDRQAILDLGSAGDKSAIPYLEKLRGEGSVTFGSASGNAQMALAKLGAQKQRAEILEEAKSDDPAIQQTAVKKLEYVGGKDAIRALAAMLEVSRYRSMKGFDPNRRGPRGELPQGRVVYPPLNIEAMKALAKIVPNPPGDINAEPTQEDVAKWRRWYEQNKDQLVP